MSIRRLESNTNASERPRRFAMAMSVFFRPLEEITWREGQVENISHSGILFRTPEGLEAGTRIEMRFDLPAEIGGEPGAHIVCAGEITRQIPAALPGEHPLLAASIADYHFWRAAAEEFDNGW